MSKQLCNPTDELWKFVVLNFRTQKKAAVHFGISQAMLSAVINKKRPIPKSILDAIGVEKVITICYVKKDAP